MGSAWASFAKDGVPSLRGGAAGAEPAEWTPFGSGKVQGRYWEGTGKVQGRYREGAEPAEWTPFGSDPAGAQLVLQACSLPLTCGCEMELGRKERDCAFWAKQRAGGERARDR
jgi:hypothetical protein